LGDLFAPALRGAFSWWHVMREMATQLEIEHLLPAATAWMGCVCLALAFSNFRRAREALLLTLLPCVSYFILMMFVAARVQFDRIENARFWIPIWPLSFLAVSALIAACTQVWSRIASVVLNAAMAAMLLGQSIVLRRNLPSALEARGLLSQRWQKASAALPEPEECRLFVTDVRPFMLHRDLGPTSEIPLTRDDFEAAASLHPSLCVATLSKRLRVSRTAEQRRKQQTVVIDALLADGRLERLARRAGVTLYRVRKP
jgi:hypothetical protein